MGRRRNRTVNKEAVMPAINKWSSAPYSENYHAILQSRRSLPVWNRKKQFLQLFTKHQILILVGETGIGKTTQIPQFVLEFENKDTSKHVIACTQPQRVSAMSAARRVAEQMEVALGEQVGYSVAFEECSSSQTLLKYLTDDMLLREAMNDPRLERYNVIILDEAHERTMANDVLCVLLKDLLRNRNDMKLIVMSHNTMTEVRKFQNYFNGAPLFEVPGGSHYPVEVCYTVHPERDYIEAAIRTIIKIHSTEPRGDVLLFVTDEEEIETACKRIGDEIADCGDKVGPVRILPLYSTLPAAMQHKVFESAPPPAVEGGPAGRKIFISTSIAETSVVMDGIAYVIDPGLVGLKYYNRRINAESLVVTPISRASAHRRQERAGLTKGGKCFRLYTEESFNSESVTETHPEIFTETCPQIQRSNLGCIVLALIKMGIEDLVHFDYMDPPAPQPLIHALDDLHYLGAIDDDGKLTILGKLMSEFPLDPPMAKMLVVSPDFNCSNEILSISAMLLVPNCFGLPGEAQEAADKAKARFRHISGDHLTLLNVYNEYKENKEDPQWCNENSLNHTALKYADYIRQQLARIMARYNLKMCSTSNSLDRSVEIRKAMLAGYFMQVAYLSINCYMTVEGNEAVLLHPSNCLHYKPKFVMYNEYVQTDDAFIRTVTDIRGEWLADVAPCYYDQMTLANWGLYNERENAKDNAKVESKDRK